MFKTQFDVLALLPQAEKNRLETRRYGTMSTREIVSISFLTPRSIILTSLHKLVHQGESYQCSRTDQHQLQL